MTAYTCTLALDQINAGRQRPASGNFGFISGLATLSNYNQTLAEITGITGKFLNGAPRVFPNGVSSLGYVIKWDSTGKAFKAFKPGTITPAIATPGAATAITPPASTEDYTNDQSVPIVLIITGQTSTHAVVKRTSGAFTSADVFTSGPMMFVLGPGDKVAVTYSGAGTWTRLNFGAITATIAGALTEVASDVDVGTFDFLAVGNLAG